MPLLSRDPSQRAADELPPTLAACSLDDLPPLDAPSAAAGRESRQPPLTPPAPCDACGCAFFWESPDRQAHCCGCVPIPARRMAVGGWVVAWVDGAAAWWEHEFKMWDPFAHLGASHLPDQNF